jgi:hypothetical protein
VNEFIVTADAAGIAWLVWYGTEDHCARSLWWGMLVIAWTLCVGSARVVSRERGKGGA